MTTPTMASGNRTMAAARPRASLEELVDKLIAALFSNEPETAAQTVPPSVVKNVHEARRLRQAGDIAVSAPAMAETREARWAYAEWLALVRRRFDGRGVLVYSQGTRRAAALVHRADGALEVAVDQGMRWETGKVVSRRSLRGLKTLSGGAWWSRPTWTPRR